MATVTLIAAIFGLAVGVGIFLMHRTRLANQVFLGMSILLSAWLLMVYAAMRSSYPYVESESTKNLLWYRLNAALASFTPWTIRLLCEAIINREIEAHILFVRNKWWLVLGAILSITCFSNSYVGHSNVHLGFDRGPAYYVHSVILLGAFSALVFTTYGQMRSQQGVRRVELQFLSLNIAFLCACVVLINAIGAFSNLRALSRISPIFIFIFQVVTAWAISNYRIYNVRQVYLSLGCRIGIISIFSIGAMCQWSLLNRRMPSSWALMLSMSVWTPVAFWLDSKVRRVLDLDGTSALSEIRNAIVNVARGEAELNVLLARFRDILCMRFGAEWALIASEHGGEISPERLFSRSKAAYAALREFGWATPESLDRRRASPALVELREFLGSHELGVIVAAPFGPSASPLIIGLRRKTSEWPYTYPEVRILVSSAELIDNILTHACLAAEMASKRKIEDLAVLSRGLAHDLKNLVTPISSFLVHTEPPLGQHGPETEVHAAAKRSVGLMTSYIGEALFFANQLEPKFERVSLAEVLRSAQVTTSVHASRKQVSVRIVYEEDAYVEADSVLIERLVVNLVGNAIDACGAGAEVALSVDHLRPGWLRLSVKDGGCGIAKYHIGRVFEPYFTTKNVGSEARGFGLGLTICQKIVELHQGEISVESAQGVGTAVRVDLPTERPRTGAGTRT